MKIALISDNRDIFDKVYNVIKNHNLLHCFDFYHSCGSNSIFEDLDFIFQVDLERNYKFFVEKYDIIFSCHAKSIFPSGLINNVLCINLHPGLNPNNRGWYPQVFSINNKMPYGATIHIMDEKIDHGEIIYQKSVDVFEYDTSLTLYNRVVEAEVEIFNINLLNIINHSYSSFKPSNEGNFNSIKDFEDLCHIDLDKSGSFREFYDLLRSLSHEPYRNAYFFDKDGKKVFISLNISIE